ncbi:hypothetical protein BKK44_01155 [Bacillus cereus]|nr:hypothetical protein BKK44_01155 [Bacillus cereus]
MEFSFHFSDDIEKYNESRLEINDSGIKRDEFYLSLTEFIRLLGDSFVIDLNKTYKSPILPKNLIHYTYNPLTKTWELFCDIQAFLSDIKAFNDETVFIKVGIPRLLIKYIFNETREHSYQLTELFIYALKGTESINEGTQIYKFPFSNVNNVGRMCTGSNRLPKITALLEAENLHKNYLFQTVFTNHFYNERNLSSYSLDKLLSKLEEQAFPQEWLIEQNMTFGEIIK